MEFRMFHGSSTLFVSRSVCICSMVMSPLREGTKITGDFIFAGTVCCLNARPVSLTSNISPGTNVSVLFDSTFSTTPFVVSCVINASDSFLTQSETVISLIDTLSRSSGSSGSFNKITWWLVGRRSFFSDWSAFELSATRFYAALGSVDNFLTYLTVLGGLFVLWSTSVA